MASDAKDPANTGQSLNRDHPNNAGGQNRERLSVEAVHELYLVHSRELRAFLTGVLRNADAAEEVAQVTFGRLLEAGHEAQVETIKGWLFKVGFHEAMAFRRRLALEGRVLQKYTTQKYGAAGNLPTTKLGLPDELVQREDVTKLRELLAELPPDQQHVVRQRMYEGKTFASIASDLDVPLGTVLTRMRLAMEKLQKRWGRGEQK